MRKLKLLFAALAVMATSAVWAQTNIIAGWDGGDDTSSPTNFGWSSSENRTMNARNAGSGIRMKTDYSGYKLEDGTEYSYSATSDPSSVLFWIRYNKAGESFTYTFQGLEADSYYDFSVLVGWHNNSYAPKFTIVLTDGTNDMTTLSKSVSQKQTLYSVGSTFKTPSTMTNTTNVQIVFTCNQTGDCMEAISALKIVASSVTDLDFAKKDALATLPATGGDNFFTMSQSAIDEFTQRINAATTEAEINGIKDEITSWVAPATSGSWNVKNVTAACYLGTDGESVVLSELPVAVSFEKATSGFYIKVGENYINMKGSNNWDMSATATATTEWTFTANDGKYTISGPNGMIGTDNTAAGSPCYGDKNAEKNGTWTITEAVSEEQVEIIVAKNALEAAINEHTVPTANIGTGVFQYNSDDVAALSAKIDAAKAVLDNVSATKAEIEEQIAILAAIEPLLLNAPAADKLFNIVVATAGHAKENNPIIIIPGASVANNPTGYAMNANFAANVNLSQAFTFTQVDGNNYQISTKLGEEVIYLTNGEKNGSEAGWKNAQIQATTDAEKAMNFTITALTTEGAFNIINTATSSTIACQAGGNIYTEDGNADFKLVETTKPSISINTTAAGWGTVMLPFSGLEVPAGVKAYTCAAVDGTTLTLEEVSVLTANTPYIIEGAWNETVSNDAQGAALTYTEGLLTGVYADADVPVGSYVLQKLEGVVGFYQVAEGKQPSVGANHAYLTVPASEVRAYFLGGDATGIEAVNALLRGSAEIYGAGGARQNGLQKGVNIIKQNGKTIKVMVK